MCRHCPVVGFQSRTVPLCDADASVFPSSRRRSRSPSQYSPRRSAGAVWWSSPIAVLCQSSLTPVSSHPSRRRSCSHRQYGSRGSAGAVRWSGPRAVLCYHPTLTPVSSHSSRRRSPSPSQYARGSAVRHSNPVWYWAISSSSEVPRLEIHFGLYSSLVQIPVHWDIPGGGLALLQAGYIGQIVLHPG